jgi:hypothetical protein
MSRCVRSYGVVSSALWRALERLFKAWRSSSGSAMNSSALPFQPQRLQSMQPINRSPPWSISIRGRRQRWQVRPNAKGDGCFFAPCEAAQARLTRLALFLPTRTHSGVVCSLAERSRCCLAVDRLDVRGEPEQGGEHGCIIGKCKATPEQCQRSIAPSKDEVGKRCEQNTTYSHRRSRIECAVVSRYQILDKRQASGELLERRPKILLYRSLELREAQSGSCLPRSHSPTSGQQNRDLRYADRPQSTSG